MLTLQKTGKVIITIFLPLFFSNTAIALNVENYEKLEKTSWEELKIYINGVGSGFSWSNSILKNRGDQVLYCPPSKIVLNAENYIDIIDARIANLKKSGKVEYPVELILYHGLVESFPCSN